MLRDRRVQLLICESAISIAGLLLVVWLLPHYAAPLTGTIFALVAQGTRHLRTWHWGTRPVGIALSRATVLCALVLSPYHLSLSDVFPKMKERAAVEQQLDRTSEQHLVIVRYSLHHNVEEEWVQNRADIDHAKVVWAREIAGVSVAPLLAYFHGRQLWLLEPDVRPVKLRPYLQQAEPAK
jgi:hypothetical protein